MSDSDHLNNHIETKCCNIIPRSLHAFLFRKTMAPNDHLKCLMFLTCNSQIGFYGHFGMVMRSYGRKKIVVYDCTSIGASIYNYK